MFYHAGGFFFLGVQVRMRVQRVVMPDGSESWTVLGPAGEPGDVVEAFLAHLQALDRSPTTARTYATTLKLWLEFLGETLHQPVLDAVGGDQAGGASSIAFWSVDDQDQGKDLTAVRGGLATPGH